MENKFLFLLTLCAFVAVGLSDSDCPGPKCIEPGWFGSGCTFKCHCAEQTKCDQETGVCYGDCEEGMFGPSCQYISLAYSRTGSGWQEITLDEHAQSVSWIRYEFNNQVPKDVPKLQYYTTEDNTLTSSPIIRWAVVDKTTADVEYEHTAATAKLKLTGKTVKHIKRIDISGGRNVALKQETNQSSTYLHSSKGVDGKIMRMGYDRDVRGACAHTYKNATVGTWRVYFDTTVRFTKIFIANRYSSLKRRMVGFRLSAKSGDNTSFTYADKESKGKHNYTIIPKNVQEASMLIIKKGDQQYYLTLCEVMVFGEKVCPDGKFGLNCERDCNCADGGSCLPTGGCPSGCKDGFKGSDCWTRNDACAEHGWFGSKGCMYKCHCANQTKCDQETGVCYEGCEKGWFGPSCQYKSLAYTRTGKYWKEITLDEHAQPISWIRYQFKRKVPKNPPKLQYYTTEDNTLTSSPIVRWAVVDKTTADVEYEPTAATSKIKLTGRWSVRYITRIDISGGRNVALKQMTNQTSTYLDSSNGVDGDVMEHQNLTAVHYDCTHTFANDTEGVWNVYFNTPIVFTEIFIANRQSILKHRLRGFRLFAKLGDDTRFTYTDQDRSRYNYTIIPTTQQQVDMITIQKWSRQVYLTLCEVMVFGEKVCPGGKYGLDCERDCNCADGAHCLTMTGGCQSGYACEATT